MRLAYACFVDLATYLPWFLICKAIVYPLPNLEDFPDHQTQLPLRFLRFEISAQFSRARNPLHSTFIGRREYNVRGQHR